MICCSAGATMIEREGRRVTARRWPIHGWLGLGIVAIFWTLNWSLPGLRTHVRTNRADPFFNFFTL